VRSAGTPAYTLVNAGLNNARLAPGWSAALRIHNLFDSRSYTVASNELQPLERIPAAGRTLWLQLRRDW
jgi:outer membrane receptor protein involved in Fe transport